MDSNKNDLKEVSLPSVRVIIVKGAEDVTIKIADKGGGVACLLYSVVLSCGFKQ